MHSINYTANFDTIWNMEYEKEYYAINVVTIIKSP